MSFVSDALAALRDSILSGTITQPFGPTSVTLEPIVNGVHFHLGTDIVLPGGEGGTVRAPASGRVVAIGSYQGLGNQAVGIRAPNGYTYILGHLHDNYVQNDKAGHAIAGAYLRVGDYVRAGDIVGHQGGGLPGEGASTGPHLHLEIHDPQGRPVNPGNQRDTRALFYSLYHTLGFGAGFLPGQGFIDAPPDPYSNNGLPPVPSPFPSPSGNTYDTGGNPGDPGSGTGDPGGGNAQLVGWNPLGGILPSTDMLRQIGPTLLFIGVGAALFIVGLVKLGQEAPVKVVTQPVIDAGKKTTSAVGKVATTAAKVAV